MKNWKLLTSFVTLILFGSLVSCSNNDNDEPVDYSTTLPGIWADETNNIVYVIESNHNIKYYTSEWGYVSQTGDYTFGTWTVDGNILAVIWTGDVKEGKTQNYPTTVTETFYIRNNNSSELEIRNQQNQVLSFAKSESQKVENYVQNYLIGKWSNDHNNNIYELQSNGDYIRTGSDGVKYFGNWSVNGPQVLFTLIGYFEGNNTQTITPTTEFEFVVNCDNNNYFEVYIFSPSDPDIDQGGGGGAVGYWMGWTRI